MAVRKKSAEVAQRQDALGRLATANAGIAQGLFAIAHSGQAPDWAMRYRNLAGRVVRTGVGISDGWTAIRSREPPSLESLRTAVESCEAALNSLAAANAGPTSSRLARAYDDALAARRSTQRLLQHVED